MCPGARDTRRIDQRMARQEQSMSNTRHTNPAAAMNGTKRPTSLQVLEVIAGGIQALAQDATRKPAGQRWHCAVCLGLMKAWELRHQEDLQVIVGQYQDRMTEFAAAFNNPDLDPAARQAMMGSQPDMQQMCAAYGQQAG